MILQNPNYCGTTEWDHKDGRVVSSPTLNELGLVGTPHVLQDAVVEGLGQLCRHGCVEVWLVALQYVLQRELAHAQHLKVHVHDAFAPRSAILVLKQPQVQDLVYSENTRESSEESVTATITLINLTISLIRLDFYMFYCINAEHFSQYTTRTHLNENMKTILNIVDKLFISS